MRPSEIKDLSVTDLEQKLSETREELFNLRFQLATGQIDNTGRIKDVKRDIARILTEMRMREIAEGNGGTDAPQA
jgi:large subunit ribosomal protein L29